MSLSFYGNSVQTEINKLASVFPESEFVFLIITHLSGIGTLKIQVAGLHRASPSATLDKLSILVIISHLQKNCKMFLSESAKFVKIFSLAPPELPVQSKNQKQYAGGNHKDSSDQHQDARFIEAERFR